MADVTFYYPAMHELRPDGTIVLRATGYEGDWRWTGVRSFSPDSQDYGFWRWAITQSRWAGASFFSSDDLPALKSEYSKSKEPS
jgi:hypothetical protein